MRVSFGNTKTHFAFLLGLVPSFFFAETYAKKDPRLRGETGGRKKESWSGDPLLPIRLQLLLFDRSVKKFDFH